MTSRSRPATLLVVLALALGCHGSRAKDERPPEEPPKLTSSEIPLATPVPAGTPDIAGLAARVSPAVVNITATQEVQLPEGVIDPFEFFFGQKRPRDGVRERQALGSGFILDEAGHVVTNAHVVENASTVRVTLSDERELEAKVAGRDERLDVAVLKLEGAKDLPRVALGRSEELRVGDYVIAIGNPFGLGNTVTMGIVSAKGRELGAGPYDDFIQTDASINPGNSGGPLFNLKGEVVGISTAIAPAGQGIGFAIPADALTSVLPQLIEKGFVSRGRLGVAIQDVDAAMAKALGLPKANGALIGDVEPDSPAVKAGIRSGDVIVSVDGTPIVHANDLPRTISRRPPGTKVNIEVMGPDKAKRTVEVTLDELRDDDRRAKRPERKPAPSPGAPKTFGVEFRDHPGGGVIVGGASSEDLRPGDIVLEVNGVRVKDAREATERLRATKGDRPALLKVQREGRTRYVALERG